MISVLWGSFPRLVERNINRLLDGAQPTAIKAFQLYWLCRKEKLYRDSLTTFARSLEEFFAQPRAEQRKSQIDLFLQRPMEHSFFSHFQLDFRSAVVSEKSLLDVASWAHNLIRVAKKTTAAFTSLEVMTATLRAITNPAPTMKAKDIEFGDFCAAWKTTTRKLLGSQHDAELEDLLRELRWLDETSKVSEKALPEPSYVPAVFLTDQETEWLVAARDAAFAGTAVPACPFSDSPGKPRLAELQRVVALYTAARTSRIPAVIKNREKIRLTLIERCEKLLAKRTELAS